MARKILFLLAGALLILFWGLWAGTQGHAGLPNPSETHKEQWEEKVFATFDVSDGPFMTSTTWSDAFHSDIGFTWMDAAVVVNEDVSLSQIVPLGSAPQGESVWALTAGADGKVYLGTSGAYLNVYDPASGSITGLGAPVPDECFG